MNTDQTYRFSVGGISAKMIQLGEIKNLTSSEINVSTLYPHLLTAYLDLKLDGVTNDVTKRQILDTFGLFYITLDQFHEFIQNSPDFKGIVKTVFTKDMLLVLDTIPDNVLETIAVLPDNINSLFKNTISGDSIVDRFRNYYSEAVVEMNPIRNESMEMKDLFKAIMNDDEINTLSISKMRVSDSYSSSALFSRYGKSLVITDIVDGNNIAYFLEDEEISKAILLGDYDSPIRATALTKSDLYIFFNNSFVKVNTTTGAEETFEYPDGISFNGSIKAAVSGNDILLVDTELNQIYALSILPLLDNVVDVLSLDLLDYNGIDTFNITATTIIAINSNDNHETIVCEYQDMLIVLKDRKVIDSVNIDTYDYAQVIGDNLEYLSIAKGGSIKLYRITEEDLTHVYTLPSIASSSNMSPSINYIAMIGDNVISNDKLSQKLVVSKLTNISRTKQTTMKMIDSYIYPFDERVEISNLEGNLEVIDFAISTSKAIVLTGQNNDGTFNSQYTHYTNADGSTAPRTHNNIISNPLTKLHIYKDKSYYVNGNTLNGFIFTDDTITEIVDVVANDKKIAIATPLKLYILDIATSDKYTILFANIRSLAFKDNELLVLTATTVTTVDVNTGKWLNSPNTYNAKHIFVMDFDKTIVYVTDDIYVIEMNDTISMIPYSGYKIRSIDCDGVSSLYVYPEPTEDVNSVYLMKLTLDYFVPSLGYETINLSVEPVVTLPLRENILVFNTDGNLVIVEIGGRETIIDTLPKYTKLSSSDTVTLRMDNDIIILDIYGSTYKYTYTNGTVIPLDNGFTNKNIPFYTGERIHVKDNNRVIVGLPNNNYFINDLNPVLTDQQNVVTMSPITLGQSRPVSIMRDGKVFHNDPSKEPVLLSEVLPEAYNPATIDDALTNTFRDMPDPNTTKVRYAFSNGLIDVYVLCHNVDHDVLRGFYIVNQDGSPFFHRYDGIHFIPPVSLADMVLSFSDNKIMFASLSNDSKSLMINGIFTVIAKTVRFEPINKTITTGLESSDTQYGHLHYCDDSIFIVGQPKTIRYDIAEDKLNVIATTNSYRRMKILNRTTFISYVGNGTDLVLSDLILDNKDVDDDYTGDVVSTTYFTVESSLLKDVLSPVNGDDSNTGDIVITNNILMIIQIDDSDTSVLTTNYNVASLYTNNSIFASKALRCESKLGDVLDYTVGNNFTVTNFKETSIGLIEDNTSAISVSGLFSDSIKYKTDGKFLYAVNDNRTLEMYVVAKTQVYVSTKFRPTVKMDSIYSVFRQGDFLTILYSFNGVNYTCVLNGDKLVSRDIFNGITHLMSFSQYKNIVSSVSISGAIDTKTMDVDMNGILSERLNNNSGLDLTKATSIVSLVNNNYLVTIDGVLYNLNVNTSTKTIDSFNVVYCGEVGVLKQCGDRISMSVGNSLYNVLYTQETINPFGGKFVFDFTNKYIFNNEDFESDMDRSITVSTVNDDIQSESMRVSDLLDDFGFVSKVNVNYGYNTIGTTLSSNGEVLLTDSGSMLNMYSSINKNIKQFTLIDGFSEMNVSAYGIVTYEGTHVRYFPMGVHKDYDFGLIEEVVDYDSKEEIITTRTGNDLSVYSKTNEPTIRKNTNTKMLSEIKELDIQTIENLSSKLTYAGVHILVGGYLDSESLVLITSNNKMYHYESGSDTFKEVFDFSNDNRANNADTKYSLAILNNKVVVYKSMPSYNEGDVFVFDLGLSFRHKMSDLNYIIPATTNIHFSNSTVLIDNVEYRLNADEIITLKDKNIPAILTVDSYLLDTIASDKYIYTLYMESGVIRAYRHDARNKIITHNHATEKITELIGYSNYDGKIVVIGDKGFMLLFDNSNDDIIIIPCDSWGKNAGHNEHISLSSHFGGYIIEQKTITILSDNTTFMIDTERGIVVGHTIHPIGAMSMTIGLTHGDTTYVCMKDSLGYYLSIDGFDNSSLIGLDSSPLRMIVINDILHIIYSDRVDSYDQGFSQPPTTHTKSNPSVRGYYLNGDYYDYYDNNGQTQCDIRSYDGFGIINMNAFIDLDNADIIADGSTDILQVIGDKIFTVRDELIGVIPSIINPNEIKSVLGLEDSIYILDAEALYKLNVEDFDNIIKVPSIGVDLELVSDIGCLSSNPSLLIENGNKISFYGYDNPTTIIVDENKLKLPIFDSIVKVIPFVDNKVSYLLVTDNLKVCVFMMINDNLVYMHTLRNNAEVYNYNLRIDCIAFDNLDNPSVLIYDETKEQIDVICTSDDERNIIDTHLLSLPAYDSIEMLVCNGIVTFIIDGVVYNYQGHYDDYILDSIAPSLLPSSVDNIPLFNMNINGLIMDTAGGVVDNREVSGYAYASDVLTEQLYVTPYKGYLFAAGSEGITVFDVYGTEVLNLYPIDGRLLGTDEELYVYNNNTLSIINFDSDNFKLTKRFEIKGFNDGDVYVDETVSHVIPYGGTHCELGSDYLSIDNIIYEKVVLDNHLSIAHNVEVPTSRTLGELFSNGIDKIFTETGAVTVKTMSNYTYGIGNLLIGIDMLHYNSNERVSNEMGNEMCSYVVKDTTMYVYDPLNRTIDSYLYAPDEWLRGNFRQLDSVSITTIDAGIHVNTPRIDQIFFVENTLVIVRPRGIHIVRDISVDTSLSVLFGQTPTDIEYDKKNNILYAMFDDGTSMKQYDLSNVSTVDIIDMEVVITQAFNEEGVTIGQDDNGIFIKDPLFSGFLKPDMNATSNVVPGNEIALMDKNLISHFKTGSGIITLEAD